MVRAHRHHYQLELDLSNYGDLLAIRYHCHDNISRQKEALNCIRAIKNVSLFLQKLCAVLKCVLQNLHSTSKGVKQGFLPS